MASSAKDIQLRELMDTVPQLKTMMAEQTELIRSLRIVIDEKTAHEAEAEQNPSLPEEDCSEEPRPRKKKASHAELFKGLTVHKQVIPKKL